MEINYKSILFFLIFVSTLSLGFWAYKKTQSNSSVLEGMTYRKNVCLLAYENTKQKGYFKILGVQNANKNDTAKVYILQIQVFDTANNILSKSETTATEKTLDGLKNKQVACPPQMK